MPMPSPPLTLFLPHSSSGRDRELARLLSSGKHARTFQSALELLRRFELRSSERRFARSLLRARTNYWLFRCDQRAFCGDFVLIDMSARRAATRRVYAIELKQHMSLRIDRWHHSVQLHNHRCAIEEIADSTGAIERACAVQTLVGDPDAVLGVL